ncbi:MAG: hypothetical protein J5613_03425 [Alphaproteobacteria bacterium]|nr:hypothetical protein [Alphaproteobacteria bacterium]
MDKQKKEDSKRNNSKRWHDRFILLSVIVTFGLGVIGFGYGAVKSVSNAVVKSRRTVKPATKKPIEIDTTYWNRFWQQNEISK